MDNNWFVVQDKYDNTKNTFFETVFTLANGYRGLRGYLPFSGISSPGNYIAGVFSPDLTLEMNNPPEILNCPNPMGLNIYVLTDSNLEKVDMELCETLSFNRKLDMRNGILYLEMEVKTPSGKILKINSESFVSRNDVHRWAERFEIMPLNFYGKIVVDSYIDASVTNSKNIPFFENSYICDTNFTDVEKGITCETAVVMTGEKVLESIIIDYKDIDVDKKLSKTIGNKKSEFAMFTGIKDQKYVFYRYGLTYASRDEGYSDAKENVTSLLADFSNQGYETEKKNHIKKMEDFWKIVDIRIEGDEKAQNAMRFNLFQLGSLGDEADSRVSIAAKGLHGEGYKGHVFWDTEIFMQPFFLHNFPEIAKNQLIYRYNTLNGARYNAELESLNGAKYAWESAVNGNETTPKMGIDYTGQFIRIWTGDEEIHITADIAYAICEYFKTTNDEEFIREYGFEMLLETARFWTGKLKMNPDGYYGIERVIGPDEFHEHVNDNFYTNFMVKINIENAVTFLEKYKDEDFAEKLISKLVLSEEEIYSWKSIADKIYIGDNDGNAVIEQFRGYFKLKELLINSYNDNGMPNWPEGIDLNDLNSSQIIKQPDVLMVMYLFPECFKAEQHQKNFEYYEKRTIHKSSLSPAIHSILGIRNGHTEKAYDYFMKTLLADLEDQQGNTWQGIHAASMGGAWLCAVNGFGGISKDIEGMLCVNPWIPENWKSLRFRYKYAQNHLDFYIDDKVVKVRSECKIQIKICDKVYNFMENDVITVDRK